MKFYRILEMVLKKYEGENEYRVSLHGANGGVLTNLNKCAEIVSKEKKRYLQFSTGTVTILKDEILEFQAKEVDKRNIETIYSMKVVETDINIEQR